MLESVFNNQDIALLKDIAAVSNNYGCNIYLIGGIVRDILLGKMPKDIDIAVEGNTLELMQILRNKLICKIVKFQKDLKTAQIEFSNDIVMDFASTRKEIYGERKGIPIVSNFGCNLKEDVMRRDFTVNAMAISLNKDNFGEIIDYVGGQEDLKNKKLRILHDNSFNDDPTRIIRGFKFSHRLGFKLEENTKKLQEEYLNNVDYSVIVSPARIKKEMYSIFIQNSEEIIEDFINQKIYKIFSDKVNDVNLKDLKILIDKYNIKENKCFLYFAGLFLNQDNLEKISNFNLTRHEIKMIQDLKFAEELDGLLDDLEVYQEYSKRSKASLVLELFLKNNNNIKKYLENLNNIKIEVTGEDLLLMGVPESKSFSDIFDKLLEEKIKGELPDKTSELRFVRKLLINNKV